MNRSTSWMLTLRRTRAALSLALPAALFAAAGPAPAAVLISQVYGGGGNSGATYTNDFVELCNNGGSAVSLAGWSLQYASSAGSSWTNSTALSGSIPAGGYVLIQLASGGAAGSPLPTPDITGTTNMSGTAGKVALVNSTALLSGTCPAGGATVVDFLGFGAAANCSLGAPTANLSSTTAAVRGSCSTTGNNAADFAIATPNPRNSAGSGGGGGGGGGTPVAAAIYTIQGSGATSPMVGQLVITSGVVTKLNNDGFFIQDPQGDGNPATSDGVFVFANPALWPNAQVGNLVQVTGTVTEYAPGAGTAATPLTEIGSVSAVGLLGNGYTITPTLVSLPLAAGDSLERFEGMLVTLSGPLTVQQNYFQARYGQLTIGVGRHETPTNKYRPGSAQALALADLQARSRLLLDDGSNLQNTNPTAYFVGGGVPRAGDQLGNLTGVLDFGLATATASGAGLYRLHPTAAPQFTATNPRTAAPPAVDGNVKLGSMNVLNFFTTFTNGQTADGQTGQGCSLGASVSAGNCRGADSLAEFTRQRDKIVRALAGLNADAVGLMEIQNNGNTAALNLVNALNAYLGSAVYAVVPAPANTGTDAIRVAMIYKPGRLALVGGSLSDTDAINNRPTLAQTFAAANGEKFSLVVNHLKSKGSCPAASDADGPGNTDAGDGQGCWNLQRVQQAQRLRTFVAQVQASAGSSDVLLVGDFNAYAQEDPIFELTGNGYIDQVGRYNALGYSYVFDGQAGRLDHAISTGTLSPKVAGTVHWHINADEQLAHDYNLEFKQPACATCAPDPYNGNEPYRASDHDPVLVGLNVYKTIQGTGGRDTLVGTPGDDIIIGGTGADLLTGNGGRNIFVYQSLRDAGDTITDFVPGQDRLDLRALLASIGWNGVDPVAEGWISVTLTRSGQAQVNVYVGGKSPTTDARALVFLSGVQPGAIVPSRDFIVR